MSTLESPLRIFVQRTETGEETKTERAPEMKAWDRLFGDVGTLFGSLLALLVGV